MYNIMENIQLNLLKDEIEKLEKFHQIQILEILVENKASFTENRNGVFVNLIKINKNIIQKIREYLLYVSNQNITLQDTEQLKEELKYNYFKGNKDKTSSLNI